MASAVFSVLWSPYAGVFFKQEREASAGPSVEEGL